MKMALLDDKRTAELAASLKKAGAAAKSNLEEKVTQQTTRLRSSTKTRKSAATRERIMAAATALMVERGNTDFQMSEVSSRCRMSKGALYYYFADKGALVEAIFDRSIDELVDSVEKAVAESDSSVEALVRLTHVITLGMASGTPLALALTRKVSDAGDRALPVMETRFVRVVSIIGDQLERAKEEGVIRSDIDSGVGALAFSGAFILPSLMHDPPAHKERDANRLADSLIDIAFNGLGTPRAKEEIADALSRRGVDESPATSSGPPRDDGHAE